MLLPSTFFFFVTKWVYLKQPFSEKQICYSIFLCCLDPSHSRCWVTKLILLLIISKILWLQFSVHPENSSSLGALCSAVRRVPISELNFYFFQLSCLKFSFRWLSLYILETHENVKNIGTCCVSDILHDFSLVMNILQQKAAVTPVTDLRIWKK